jgi:hypothetical protein
MGSMRRSTKLDHAVNQMLPQSEDTAEILRDTHILINALSATGSRIPGILHCEQEEAGLVVREMGRIGEIATPDEQRRGWLKNSTYDRTEGRLRVTLEIVSWPEMRIDRLTPLPFALFRQSESMLQP